LDQPRPAAAVLGVVVFLALSGSGVTTEAADEAPSLRLLRLPTSEGAESVRRRLAAGESFARLAQEYSEDRASAPHYLGRLGLDEVLPALRAAGAELGAGEVSPVLQVSQGFLVMVRDIEPRSYLEALPDPVLGGAEPQVADRIRERRAAVEAAPTSAEAWGALAMSLDIHDFKLEALDCYPQAAELDPGEFRWPYLAALDAQKVGDPEAPTWFERALAVRGDYPPLLVRHGELMLQRGEIETAAKRFRRALELEPRMAFAHLGLAQVLVARGELDAAAGELAEAERVRPGFREARSLLAEIYRRQGRAEDAARLRARLGGAFAETPLHDPVVRDTLEAEGVSAHWHDMRSRRASSRGDWERGIAESRQAIRAKPHGVFFNNYAVALVGAGRIDEALAALTESLSADPDFALTYVNLASLRRARGETDEAVATVRGGLERLPEDTSLLRELIWTLATAPDAGPDEAAEALQVAARLLEQSGDPDAAALDAVAAAHAAAGQFDEARAIAERALARAEADGQQGRAAEIEERLALYRSDRRFVARP
jgi:tetratricopeptide (TPR) repeat protein